MKSALDVYIGKTVADFALNHGSPTNTIDMGGNKRGFQWEITGITPGAIVPIGGAPVTVPSQEQTCRVAVVASTNKPSPTLADWIIES